MNAKPDYVTQAELIDYMRHHAALAALQLRPTSTTEWVEHANALVNAVPKLIAEIARLHTVIDAMTTADTVVRQ